jgi:exodeoxyribonuclease I
MSQTFFWYDLETSGIKAGTDRIMQFAGRRTSLSLEPIDEPVNVLIRLADDILPSPEAIFITGITPQQTRADGITEAEFLKIFEEQVATPGTIFAGFNSVRFDDEFMRYLHYRNFYDPYVWQWKDDRSRWDLLDVVRMTRALRPEGITWPSVQGVATNRLELLTKVNGIAHHNAHDALADVEACIAVAKLIQEKQPKLFDWLLKLRDKKTVRELVMSGQPFVYSSGKYPSEFEKTTVAMLLAEHPKKQGALVYDLRVDPTEFLSMNPEQLHERWRWEKEPTEARLPIKSLQFNRCPAVAPYGVLDPASIERIKIDEARIKKHRALLHAHPEFITQVMVALSRLDEDQARRYSGAVSVDASLYDGFFSQGDTKQMSVLRATDPSNIAKEATKFTDTRLQKLAPLYKARNYPNKLTDEERQAWEAYRHQKLLGGGQRSEAARYFEKLGELYQTANSDQRFLLEELQLYAESILPLEPAE